MKIISATITRLICTVFMVVLISVVSNAQPGKVWEFQTEGRIFSSAQVSDGIVIIGSDDHYLYALNADTGEELWKFEAYGKVRSTAAIKDSIIVIASGSRLYGLNKASGQVLWKHEPEEIIGVPPFNNQGRWDFHDSSPILVDSIAYYGNDYGTIYGVNIYSGVQTYKFQSEAETAIRTKPAVVGDTLYFGDWDGNLFATKISDTSLVWQSTALTDFGPPFYGQVTTDIIVEGDYLFYGGHLEIVNIVNRQNGNVQEAFRSGGSGWISGFPEIINGNVVIGGSDYHNIISFDKDDFSVNWVYNLSNVERVFSQPFQLDSLIGVAIGGGGGGDSLGAGSILFIDEVSAKPVAKITIDAEEGVGHGIMNTPFRDGKDLYFGTYGGKVIKVNLDNHIDSLYREVDVDTGIVDFGELRLRSTGYRGRVKRIGIHNNGDGFEYFSTSNLPDSVLKITNGIDYLKPGVSSFLYVDITLPEETPPGFYETTLEIHFNSFPDTIFTKRMKYSIENDLITTADPDEKPKSYLLSQNYPNPFNPSTNISFELAAPGYTTLSIFNVAGREVATLVNELKTKGNHTVTFNALGFSSGVYFYVLKSGEFVETRKMVLLK